jgi:hypothetical protein
MVPVSDVLQQSFAAELSRIENVLTSRAGSVSPATGLARHIYKLASVSPPPNIATLADQFPAGSLDEAPQLALAGYSIASVSAATDQLARWREGLRRLSKRDAFPRDHQTFAFRPAELVGLALGVRTTEADASALRSWLREILAALPAKGKCTLWNRLWNAYAALLLGISPTDSFPNQLDELDAAELSALRILENAAPLDRSGSARTSSADLEGELLRRVAISSVVDREVERLAAIHAGLQLAVAAQLDRHLTPVDGLRGGTRGALDLLEQMWRKFDQFVRELQKRHANRAAFTVTDEYDVQDLIHAILLLHFNVVIPEDAVPARAGNKSRLDFFLKRERVIIETKMTRKGLDQSAVHDELVADRDRYKAHPDCDVLVCLVYDPGRHFHNPAAFEHDLNSDQDSPRMRAFVCPQ